MTAYASAAAGSWSSASSWSPSGVPGNDDYVTLTHAITVDDSRTVGTSPTNGGQAAVTVNAGGSLTIATGATLTVRGDIKLNDRPMTMNAGSSLKFDSSAAASPSATKYRLHISTGHNQTSARLNVNGTSGNRCSISSVKTNSAGNGFISGSDGVDDWLQGGMITGTYCDLTNVGDSSNPAIQFGPTSTSSFSIDNFVFDSCGKLQTSFNIADGTTVSITNCTWKNTLASSSMQLNSPNGITAGTRRVRGCVFDKLVELYPPQGITIGGSAAGEWCVFGEGVDCTTSAGKWASMTSCLLQAESNPYGDMTNCYVLEDNHADNPHPIAPASGAGAGLTFDGLVFECPDTLNTTDAGDLISIPNPSSTQTYTIRNCLAVPNNNGTSPGVLFSMLGGANSRVSCNHNTWVLTANDPTSNFPALGSVGETFNTGANQVTSFKSNIAYSNASRNAYLYRNINGSPNNDTVGASDADYNLMYNLQAGSEGKGYNAPITGSPGANDKNVDPQFYDATRNIKSWAGSLGGTATTAFALAELKKKNDATGYNSNYTVAALWQWVRDGFRPQNQALIDAGHDGEDIGAIAVIVASTPKGGALFAFGIG